MREKLLEVLAEPGTLAPLRLEADRGSGDRIETGRLVSDASGQSYPILGGIPRFVAGDNYADSFGMQWNRFRGVQVDSLTGAGHSRERFDAEAGWTEAELAGKWLLDAGCGAGRFAEIAAARGPNLVALDFSSAVNAASETLARFPNADVVQGNLLEPPFREGAFDFAYCIGVIQHTPDPPRVAANVVRCVRPGGRFCLTIYGRRPWTRLNTKYLIRPLTRRLPKETLLKAIQVAMPLAFPVADALYRLPGIGRAARFALPIATYPERVEYTREQRYHEAVLDTFDMLSPRYDSPMTAEEVERILRAEHVSEFHFKTRVPIVAVGER